MVEGNGCPMHVGEVDLMSPAVQEDWYPTYDLLREQAPVYNLADSNIFVLTRYEDIVFVMRNPDRFPNGSNDRNPLLKFPEARQIYVERGWERKGPLGTNPPIHRIYRSLVDPFFTPAGAAKRSGKITELVDSLIEQFIGLPTIEFMRDFARPLPVMVITAMLGFPLDDLESLRRWSAAWVMPFARGLTLEQEIYVAEQGVEFQHYIHAHLQRRRAEPGDADDVMTHLVNCTATFPDGETRALTDAEIINILDHLYIGGNETTTFALTSGLWLLLRQPEIEARLRANPKLIGQFIEEVLRLESPTQGLYRMAGDDWTIHGVTIPKDSVIHIRYAAGNRDQRMFPDPEVLDLDRSNSARHVAFGIGEHHCPGAGLSRAEQLIAWQRLFARVESFRAAPGRNDFKHLPGFVLRSLNELWVDIRPAGMRLDRVTDEFTASTTPKGLLRAHRVAAGAWGRLHVRAGSLTFIFEDRPGNAHLLGTGESIDIPPGIAHRVEPGADCRFVVEFYEIPA